MPQKNQYLENYTEDQIYDHFAERLENGATYNALNHYIKALNRWNKSIKRDLQFNLYKEEKKNLKDLLKKKKKSLT